MPPLIDHAICIRQWDWSETSQTVSVFTRHHGLLRGLAKGSKREKSSFSGGFELLTRGELTAIVRPSAELANLTAWDLQETFPPLRRSLSAFYAGMYMADVIHHALHERDPHPRLFDALLASLRSLGAPGDPLADARAVLMLQWAAIVEGGYKPELRADVATQRPLAPAKTYAFAPRLGGFTADAPPRRDAPRARPERDNTILWRVRAETLDLLRSLESPTPNPAPSTPTPPLALDRANRFLAAYLREVLGREIPSAAHLFGNLRA